MNKGYKLDNVYDLGGTSKFIIEYRDGNNVLYYGFKADNKLQIVNMIARVHNSQTYIGKEGGRERIYVLNSPNLVIYFK